MTKNNEDAEVKAKAEAEPKAKADEEAKAKADAEAEETDESEEESEKDESEEEGGSSSTKIDYKAELEKEREARKKAESLIAYNKFKGKHKKDEEQEENEEGDDNEDKPLTRKELAELLEQNRQATLKETQSERILEIVNSLADSPEEAELIAEIHKNRSFPTYLSLKEQVEEAHAIANRKKIVSEKSEIARALKAKGNVSKDTAGTFRDGQQATQPKLAKDIEISLKRAGFVYDVKSRLYKKQLPNGKFLVKDSKGKTLGLR
jgi:fused signal recognition particle receptor